MHKSIQTAADRISRLEVQGARNVAIAAIKAIETLARDTRAKNKKDLLQELIEAKLLLFSARATEPFMRNAIRWIISDVQRSDRRKAKELVQVAVSASKAFLKSIEASKAKIAEIGSRRIPDGSAILTHCHSSTVTHMLKKAWDDGKSFEVFCTETRPRYQGRLTAREMSKLGAKTTLIVDSAARFFMNRFDLVVVGADAITSEGNVINKIGTSTIALVARESRIPFYVVSELLKFDPLTMYGDYEKIEERPSGEVWRTPTEHMLIRNPAFDITRRDFIHGIICEEGIVSPHSIVEVVRRKHDWIFEEFSALHATP